MKNYIEFNSENESLTSFLRLDYNRTCKNCGEKFDNRKYYYKNRICPICRKEIADKIRREGGM